MGVNRNNGNIQAYTVGQPMAQMAPLPIISDRAPTTADRAEIGTSWVHTSANAVYVLTSVVAGVATWSTSPASGVGIFASVTITGGVGTVLDVQLGNVVVTSGDLTVTAGNTTLGGNLSVVGNVTVNGDFDISDTASIGLTSTNNAAGAIALLVNGGAAETMTLTSSQGTGAAAIGITATAGGVTITGGLATADAINLVAGSGGIDVDAALLISVTSTRNNAQAILLEATLGGIDILASGAGAGEDIDIVATGSSVNINSTENVADSIVISSTNGGIDISALGASAGEDIDITATGSSVNVTSTEDAALAVYLHANGGTSETVQIHADQGTGVASINVLSDVGGITLRATGLASADAINLEAVAGGIDADAALQINVASSQAAVDALRFVSSDAAGGIDIDCGTGGITIDSTGAFSIDGAAASNITTTGAGIDLTLSSVLGSVLVESTEDAALAIRLHANGGTSETIQLHSDQGTGVGSVNLLSDVGGITLTATGLASADAINLEAPAGGIDMDAALQINIASSQNTATAISLNASAGGMEFIAAGAAAEDIVITNTAGSIRLTAGESAADSIVLTSSIGGIDILAAGAAAGEDIDIIATGSSVNVTSTEATADAIVLNASNAAGGIDLLTGGGEITISSAGIVTMVPATDTQASPTAASTVNANVGRIIFTGFTTASAGTQTFTITNSKVTATSGVFVTAAHVKNVNANVRLTVQDVEIAAAGGSFLVKLTNAGADALDGNIILTFWIIS